MITMNRTLAIALLRLPYTQPKYRLMCPWIAYGCYILSRQARCIRGLYHNVSIGSNER